MIVATKTTARIYLNTMTIVINTVMVLKTVKVAKVDILGRIRSKIDTSFENMVKILPIGLESKKRILERIIVVTIFLCKFVVQITNRRKMQRDLKNVRKTYTTINTPKKLGKGFFDAPQILVPSNKTPNSSCTADIWP